MCDVSIKTKLSVTLKDESFCFLKRRTVSLNGGSCAGSGDVSVRFLLLSDSRWLASEIETDFLL